MAAVDVYTQEELVDELARDGVIPVCCGDGCFIVAGSAHVRACDAAQVRAFGSARIEAHGSARIEAYGTAQVKAYGTAQIEAHESTRTEAYDLVQIRAYGSAQVRAHGSAQIQAFDSAKVEAGTYVSVTVHGDGPQVQGGVVIRVPDLGPRVQGGVLIRGLAGPREWCDYHGIAVDHAGCALLYKAVYGDWRSHYGAIYRPGVEVSCPDWDPEPRCGGGLHLCPRPWVADRYFLAAERYVACRVRVDEMVVIDDSKVKAPRCWPEFECDRDGQRIGGAQEVSDVA